MRELLPRLNRQLSLEVSVRAKFSGGAIFEFGRDLSEFRLGKLTAFIDSELVRENLKAWRSASSHESPKLRRISIQFLSENLTFHVLAVDVFLSNELSGS